MVDRFSAELEVAQKASSVRSGPLRRSEGVVMRLTTEYPVKRICQVLDYPLSSYGSPNKGREEP